MLTGAVGSVKRGEKGQVFAAEGRDKCWPSEHREGCGG